MANVTATMNETQVPSCLNPFTKGKRIGFNFAYSFYKIKKYKIKTGKKVISEKEKSFHHGKNYLECSEPKIGQRKRNYPFIKTNSGIRFIETDIYSFLLVCPFVLL